MIRFEAPDGARLEVRVPLREFDPMRAEHDYLLDHEYGTLPPGLRGTLYRNGPGRWESGGSPLGHIFDGDGMLSMFRIADGAVRFRNRYVRTTHYLRGNQETGPAGRGVGTFRGDGSLLANAFRWPVSHTANTNVVLHAGELLALHEASKPYAIDPDTLDTKGIHDFAGRLRGLGHFSAHPKLDPRTGELYNFGMAMYPVPGFAVYRVDKHGALRKFAHVPLVLPRMNHDCGITDRYLVLVLDPMIVMPHLMIPVFLGLRPFSGALSYEAGVGTDIVLIPRDGGRTRTIHTDPLVHFHIGNCFDDRDDVVIELVPYRSSFDALWDNFHRGWDEVQQHPIVGGPVTRLRITKAGRVIREDRSDRALEFPQIDQRFCGQPTRYSYSAGTSGDPIAPDGSNIAEFDHGVTTIDHRRETESTYRVPEFGSACEPVFVPRAPDAPEGDGWLLTVEYLRSEHRSRLIVLDAAAPDRGPVFAAGLRHHLALGFHGTFVPEH